MTVAVLKAPFPYMGGKSKIAPLVWSRLGPNLDNYVEPFCGSSACLLARPGGAQGIETVNDADGLLANFWRALAADPECVAHHADWPVSECDLHARHIWLVNRRADMTRRLEGDPEWFDAKAAGWWVWGASLWIGGGWCSGEGPWQVDKNGELNAIGGGVKRKRPHLGDAGQGVNRKRPHLGDAGQGVNRKLPHLGNAGQGVNRKRQDLMGYFAALADRLRGVRVCCGDWSRVSGRTPTVKNGLTGVFLDPPYLHALRDSGCYAHEDDCGAAVREWAISAGDDPRMRVALCGYEGEHAMPTSWECVAWKAHDGYGSQSDGRGRANAGLERVWFSPHCLRATGLFEECGLE